MTNMHMDPYRKWGAQAVLCSVVFASGCDKVRSLVGSEQKPAALDASAGAAVEGSARSPEAQPACNVLAHKVWGKYANRRTGITATRFGERVALGVALGNQPHVLVVEPSGEAKLIRLSAPAGSALAADIPAAAGQRDLQRVTPVLIGGRISGLADYRDTHKNKRRRIACGPAEASTTLLAFDGRPRFDIEPKKPDAGAKAKAPPKPAAVPDAGKAEAGSDAATPAAPAAPIAAAPPSLADAAAAQPEQLKTAPKSAKKAEREIRDCRSFVDSDGTRPWAIGSELHGEEQAGKTKWSMRLVVLPAQGAEPFLVHTVPLPDEPKEFHTFESPAAEQLRDGSYALAARYRGALFGWTLNANKRRIGLMRVYVGGYPTLVHFVPDGMDYVLLTSQKVQGERYELRYGRIDGQRPVLPSTLFKPAIEGSVSLAEPTLARSGKQRWLAYQGGDSVQGRLLIVPVDHALTAVGRPHALSEGQRSVHESVLLGLTGERLLAVFLQDSGAGAELVSEVLSCRVQT